MNDTHTEMGVPVEDPVDRVGRQRYGVRRLYPLQRFVVANILEGISQIVVFPTGGGKSLCFQVPAHFLTGPTLVVTPLLALMRDQRRRLAERGVPSVVLRGEQSAAERRQALDDMRTGKASIVFVTPEALVGQPLAAALCDMPVAHVVVDEAHCVSEWGETFRPAYLRLGEIVARLKPEIVTAFTATASRRVLERVRKALFAERPAQLVIDDPDRPNIFYRVLPTLSPTQDLLTLAAGRAGAMLVFSRTRGVAERMARLLRRRIPDSEALFYHAGLDAEERREVEDRFLDSSRGVLVATCAYGMGVDKKNIRAVVHLETPASVEAYLQESGRAGRDGLPAEATLLARAQTTQVPALFDTPGLRERYLRLAGYPRSTGCRRRHLLALMGYEVPHCSGCDFCAGDVVSEPDGMRVILAAVRRRNRCLSLEEAVDLLLGRAAAPLLPGWAEDQVREALRTLVVAGELRIGRGPLWPHRLVVPQRRRSQAGMRVPGMGVGTWA